MSSNLDVSLDDLIKSSRKSGGQNGNSSRGRGRSRGRSYGPGPDRRFPIRNTSRTTPYYPPPALQVMDPIFQQQIVLGGGSNTNPEEGTKLYVSNLDYSVSNDDIQVLFSEVGVLKRYSIHYDRSGRSKGTAEVVFSRQSDALAAVKRYNNVQLDGKPMKIELVGVNLVTPAVVPPSTNSILGKPNASFRSGQWRVGARPRGFVRGGSVGYVGRGLARGRVQVPQGRGGRFGKVTAEDLDADLEQYHFEAMKIN